MSTSSPTLLLDIELQTVSLMAVSAWTPAVIPWLDSSVAPRRLTPRLISPSISAKEDVDTLDGVDVYSESWSPLLHSP